MGKPYAKIISRADWGARAPRSTAPLGAIVGVVVHHTADAGPRSKAKAAEQAFMRSIQNFHMDTRDWADIAYHLIIMPSGRVYRGRTLNHLGAHVEGHNTGHVGICFAGNFETQHPTREALLTLTYLVRHHPKLRGHPVQGHRDFGGTACPGDNLYPITQKL